MASRIALIIVCFIIATLTGCQSCQHNACNLALAPYEESHATSAQRNRLHVFLFNGREPSSLGGMLELREKLNNAGYAKVHYGELYHSASLENEIIRLAQDDENNRFLIVSYAFSKDVSSRIANRCIENGIRVRGVIEIAPMTINNKSDATHCELTKITSTLHQEIAPASTNVFIIPNSSSWNLPSHPETGKIVINECSRISKEIVVDEIYQTRSYSLLENPAPLPTIIGNDTGSKTYDLNKNILPVPTPGKSLPTGRLTTNSKQELETRSP